MIPKRLKQARLTAKLTQEELGILAGIDEATAHSRLSHYEKGTHKPSFDMVCDFARALDVPECYFYTIDDEFTDAVLALYQRYKSGER